MKVYHLHKPNPTRKQALSIPLYVRSGKQVTQILSVNDATRRVICTVEGSEVEHTYDIADLVHHYGEAGVRHYLSSTPSEPDQLTEKQS